MEKNKGKRSIKSDENYGSRKIEKNEKLNKEKFKKRQKQQKNRQGHPRRPCRLNKISLFCQNLDLHHLCQIAHQFHGGMTVGFYACRVIPKGVEAFTEHFFEGFLVNEVDVESEATVLNSYIADAVRKEQGGKRHAGLGKGSSAVENPVIQNPVGFRQGGQMLQTAHALLRRQIGFISQKIHGACDRKFI